jgi:hypothetical protein
MSIPSKIPTNPMILRLEKELKKAHGEIEYWVKNHADALEDIVGLEKKIEDLKCELKEKE